MHVRMLTSMATTRASYKPGDVVELDEVTARRLIERGHAQAIEAPAGEAESASLLPPETAARGRAPARRAGVPDGAAA